MRSLLPLILIAAAAFPAAHAKAPADAELARIAPAAAPSELPDDSRIVMFTFSPDAIFRVYTTPGTMTHLELEADEGIVEKPALGDTMRWRVAGGPRNLFIKPLTPNLVTSMTVVTDKRTYQLELISGEPGAKRYQKVTFHYPEEEAALTLKEREKSEAADVVAARAKERDLGGTPDPTAYDFAYDIDGDATFRPVAVFNDGKQTYIRLPQVQDRPAVFLYEDKKPSLVNYLEKGDYLVVDRVASNLLLKLGSREVRVSRKTGLFGWGRN